MYIGPLNDRPKPRIVFTDNSPEPDRNGWREFFRIFWKSKIIKTIVFLIFPLIFLNYWLFRYDDFANGCHVKINPSITEMNNLQIKKAIRLLKDKDPMDYQKFCSSVKIISPELACGGAGGGCFSQNRPEEIVVSTIFRSLEAHTETTSAIMMHEVCHLFQFKENRKLEELECYREYCRILKVLGVREDYDKRCLNEYR